MVKSKPQRSWQSIVLALTILISIIGIGTVHAASRNSDRIELAKTTTKQNVPTAHKTAVTKPENTSNEAAPTQPPEETPAPPPVDPNGCEAQGMHWRADNYECIAPAAPASVTESVASITPETPASVGSGDCATEIARYDWNQSAAYRVMMMESSNNPSNLNNNPATGDYSVGCFQINIYGANAASRPSEAALKSAATNVAFAYKLWSGTGSFYSNWPNTCAKVGC